MTENEIINKHKKLFDAAASLPFHLYCELKAIHKRQLLNKDLIITLTGKIPDPNIELTAFDLWNHQGYYSNVLKVCILNLASMVESFFKEYFHAKFPNGARDRGFFQRLDEFDDKLGTDFSKYVEFQKLKDFMQIRHIYQHADGLVDKSFLEKFKRHSNYKEGELYLLDEKEVSDDYTNFRSFLNSLLK